MAKLVKYGIVGATNTLLTFAVFELLLLGGASADVANFTGYAAGICNSLVGNKLWVFRTGRGRWRRETLLFLLGAGVCYLLQWGAFRFFLTLANEHWAQVLGMGVYTALNYVWNRFVAFGKCRPGGKPHPRRP